MDGSASREPTERGRRRQRRRRIWFTIHSLVGVKLYLLLAVILITGTLAVFAREIDWLLLPEMRVTPRGERATLGEMVAALRAAHPRVGILEGFVETNVEHPRSAARAIGPDFAWRKAGISPLTSPIPAPSSRTGCPASSIATAIDAASEIDHSTAAGRAGWSSRMLTGRIPARSSERTSSDPRRAEDRQCTRRRSSPSR